MGPNKSKKYQEMGQEWNEAISAFVDAHFSSDSQLNEPPLCTPGEFGRALDGRLPSFVEADLFLSCALSELNDGEKRFARGHFSQRWQKLPSAVAAQTMANEHGRVLAIPLINRLTNENTDVLKEILIEQQVRDGEIAATDACELRMSIIDRNAKFNTAAATVLAREYLLRWRAGQADEKLVDIARTLLEEAADQGDPQACYMLANERLAATNPTYEDTDLFLFSGKSDDDDYLCPDKEARRRYHDWAVSCGHKPSVDKEDKMHYDAKEWKDIQQDAWLYSLDEDLRQLNNDIRRFTPNAEAGHPVAQYELGCALIEKQNLLAEASRTGIDQSVIDQAISLINQAAPNVPQARYTLGLEEEDAQRAINFLRSAAFPPETQNPDFRALIPLSERLIEDGDICGAEEVLRFAVGKKLSGEKSVGDVEVELAKLLDKHAEAIGANLSEARKLYLAHAHEPFDDAWPSLRAAIMCLRGEGGPKDLDTAHKYFAQAVTKARRNEQWRLYAELALDLGWGGVRTGPRAVERLIKLLTLSRFAVDEQSILDVSDIELLYRSNIEFQSLESQLDMCFNEEQPGEAINAFGPLRPYGDLILALASLLTTSGSESKWLNSVLGDSPANQKSMVVQYVRAGLLAFGGLGTPQLQKARKHLIRLGEIEGQLAIASKIGPNLTLEARFFNWLRGRASRNLVNIILEKLNIELQQTNSRLDRVAKELELAKTDLEDMMAMFAHKFRGPVDSIISNAEHHLENRDHLFKDLGRTMNGLLDIFSFVSSHSEKLIPRLREDNDGPHTLAHVMHKAIWLAVVQLLTKRNIDRMNKHYYSYAVREKRIPAATTYQEWRKDKSMRNIREAIRATWEMEIGAYGDFEDLNGLLGWVSSKLMPVCVDGLPVENVCFSDSGTKESLLLVIFTEVFVNAIKHYESLSSIPIRIEWIMDENKVTLSCVNPTSNEARIRGEGSGRGFKFLSLIARNVGGEFWAPSDGDEAIARFTFPSLLFK